MSTPWLFRRTLLVALVTLIISAAAFAQTDPGTGFPSFGTFNRDNIDTINVGNLNVHLEFPMFEKKGVGLNFSVNLIYDNTPYRPATPSGNQTGPTNWNLSLHQMWGVAAMGFDQVSYTSHASISPPDPVCYNSQGQSMQYYILENFVYTDVNGTAHPFGGSSNVGYPVPCYATQSTTGYSIDGQYSLSVSINPTTGQFLTETVTDMSGNVRNLLGGTLTDPNGNTITLATSNTSPWTWTDTTGNTAMTSSAIVGSETLDYPNPSGGVSESVTLTYSNFTLQTNYACPEVLDVKQTISLTTGISLPDGTSYAIVYESTNGAYPSTITTGRIHSLTLPSGATITYTYSGGTNGINCQDGSPAILTKQTPDGIWTYNHSFTPTSNGNGYWTTIVTDPVGNDTVYTYGSINTNYIPAGNTYETERQIYQGSHTSGTLLEQVVTCYNAKFTNCTTASNAVASIAEQVTQKDAYTYLSNGSGLSQPSLSETVYNGYGLVTQDNEFDFGVNTGAAPTTTPLRATMTTYANLGSGIQNRPACVEVSGGSSPSSCGTTTGTAKSVTNYLNYDDHGNVGNIQKWVSGSTFISDGFTYTSKGQISTATDFRGTPTTYTYGAPSVSTSLRQV